MKLKQISDRIWYYPYEDERDRPILGYIRGDRWSLAVDAGHSAAHVEEFYQALRYRSLPLPQLTVLTHWHWDHSLGLHAINGLSMANTRTNAYLNSLIKTIEVNGPDELLGLDISIQREYSGKRPVIVKPADIVFSDSISLDPGNCTVKLIRTPAPHTDDSTLVFIPSEKILFSGDCTSGTFPTWKKDPELCRKLADTLADLDFSLAIGSHWDPETKAETLSDLRDAINRQFD